MKEHRLLNIFLYLRRAAEGCVSEKDGTDESYLVFSNCLFFLYFIIIFLSTLLGRTTAVQSFPISPCSQDYRGSVAWASFQFPVLYSKQEMKKWNRFFFKGTTNIKLHFSYQILLGKKLSKISAASTRTNRVGSFISLSSYLN